MKNFLTVILTIMLLSLSCDACGKGKEFKLLYWNIQNGMWHDQGNGYDGFVKFVQELDPDICVWCEAESRYVTDKAVKMQMPEDQYLPWNWDILAARYGHKYTLICGEKRLRACDSLGETTIKSIINDKELTPQQILALQIVENLQRSDPPIVDLSVAIRRMSEECLLSIDEIGKLISMKKTNVYNLIAISKLSDYEKETFKEMGITFLRSYVAFRNAHTDSDVVERFINRCNQALADLEITGDPEENTKEKRVALITTIFENVTADLKKIKAKEIAADKKKRDEEQEPELAIGKKLSLSWDKIDKIEPDLSVQLNDFLKENEDYKLETVVAEAISQYLKSMNGTL